MAQITGSFTATGSGTTAGANAHGIYIDWSETVDTANNSSTVVIKLYVGQKKTWGSYNLNGAKYTLTVDGTSVANASTYVYDERSYTGEHYFLIDTVTKKIAHKSDGTKSITISATFDLSATTAGYGSVSGTATLTTIATTTQLAAPKVTISSSGVVSGSSFSANIGTSTGATSYILLGKYGSAPTKTSYTYTKTFSSSGSITVPYTWTSSVGTLYVAAYATSTSSSYTDSNVGTSGYISVTEKITLSTPSISGSSSITGGNSATYTGTNNSYSKYPSSSFLFWDSADCFTSSDNPTATGTLTPKSAGTYYIYAYVSYGGESESNSKKVTVSDPSYSPSFSPSNSQVCSSVKCSCSASGTIRWFLDVGTTASYAQAYCADTYNHSAGSTYGHKFFTGNTITITKDDIQSCIINGSSYETLYFVIGCQYVKGNYTCASKWQSGTYTFGEFNGSVTNLTHWNDYSSSTPSTKSGTLANYFYDYVMLRWTNPTSARLLGYSINNISIQTSTDGGTSWGTLSSDMVSEISKTAGVTNTVKVKYSTYGAVQFRIKVDTSNNTSTTTTYSTTLNSLQCQLDNLQVNTVANLHPYTNTTTILKFKWFDENHTNMQNGEKIKIQFFIRNATEVTELNSVILSDTSYTSAVDKTDDTTPKTLCYVNSASPYYYYNLATVTETNNLFFNTLGSGTFDGLYKYRIQLTYTNNFGVSVVITSDQLNANFGQPPAFASGSSVTTRYYYYDLAGTSAERFAILTNDINTVAPSTYNYMINPDETLLFSFPIATDPNNNLAGYRLEVCRFDEYDPLTSPTPENATGYELLKIFKIGYGSESADDCYYRANNKEYIYYTLGSYAYSKFCYFRVYAVDSYEDLSDPIYYSGFVARGRDTTANLTVDNVLLGYYVPTSDTTPSSSKTYYTYDAAAMRYIKWSGTVFEEGVTYYEKVNGISADLNVAIGNTEPDLGGNYFRDSTKNLYSDYANLDYYLKNQSTDERLYKLTLQWSNNVDFKNDSSGSKMDYIDLYNNTPTSDLYIKDIITYSSSKGYSAKNYKSGTQSSLDTSDYKGKKIYVRFVLTLRRGKPSNGTSTYRTITTYSPVVIIYNSTPTISPRPNRIGINTNDFETNDVVKIAMVSNQYIVRFHGEDSQAKELEVTLDLRSGAVAGAIIDAGTW